MKRTKLLFILMLAVATSLSACKKSDDDGTDPNDPSNNPPTENIMQCKIDGVTYTFDQSFAASSAMSGSLYVTAESATGETLTVQMNLWNETTGTYNMTPTTYSNIGSVSYDDGSENFTCPNYIDNNTSNQATGTMKITYYDGTKIAGTFSGTVAQNNSTVTHTVTEGKFSAISIQ